MSLQRLELAKPQMAEFHTLAEQIPAIVYRAEFAPPYGTIYISPGIAELGYSQDEWTSDPNAWQRAIHPDDQAAVFRELAALTKADGPVRIAYRLRDSAGEWHHFHDVFRVVRDEAGRPLYVQGVVIDITDRVKADAALRSSETQTRMLSQVIEQCSESVVITDLCGTIEYVNRATLAATGYEREELLGRHARVLKSGDTALNVYQEMRAFLTAGRPWRGTISSKRSDGAVFTESAIIMPIRDDGGIVTHFAAIKADVTEMLRVTAEVEQRRHHVEKLVAEQSVGLKLATQLAHASKAKSEFLARMSHEIRTPMNGVIGLVDVLRMSNMTPYQADLADTIRDSAIALLSVVDGILDFSKIEAGHLELEREPVQLVRLVEGVCNSLQPMASSRGVRLRVFSDPRLPDWIIGDASRLRRIIVNLVGNAIKFSAGLDREGQVWLRAERDDPDKLRLTVSDNGIGMPPEVQDQIFAPFTQAEVSTTRRYGGTGLGLAICQRLVGLLNGTIDLSSAPDKGSTFTVTLPLVEDRVQPPLPASDLAGLDCVIISRDPTHCQDWSSYLSNAGARATVRHDLAASREHGHNAKTVMVVDTQTFPAEDLAAASHAPESPSPPTILLETGHRPGIRQLGPGLVSMDVDAIRHDALPRAVLLAVGRVPPDPVKAAIEAHPEEFEPPSIEQAAAQGRLVLVAEDDDLNKKVIRHQLTSLGVACEVAVDGIDALDQWRSGRFGLLLTDLHMPGMDGYQLAAAIRQDESPARRTPIVALTANALKGEADRCRAAGMDDYLTKPLQLGRLQGVLSRFLPAGHAPNPRYPNLPRLSYAPAEPEQQAPVLDQNVLPRLVGDAPGVLASFRRDYMASARRAGAEIRMAISGAYWEKVAASAHRLKSSSRTVGALALGELCERLERAGRTDDGGAILALQSQFDAALDEVLARLASLPAGEKKKEAPKVLLVDDDPMVLDVMLRQLASLGVTQVQACSSGATALQLLEGCDTSSCLLLLDLNMPVMDGVEFIRHLAARHYAGALALISAADDRILEAAFKLAKAYRINILRHVSKPVASSVLQAILDQSHGCIPASPTVDGARYGAVELRRALDEGQLLLHYQPKVSLLDGTLTGVEALARWRHPDGGLVYPGSFIGVAEEHGLIDKMTRALLPQALREAARLNAAGMNLQVAFNVSMGSLSRLDFSEFVLEQITRAGLAPSDLCLEITESLLPDDVRAPMEILTRLRLNGVGLSIDDFGTGHSSLEKLRDMPFDELKIDRGFVHGSVTDATRRAIFLASLKMAHELGMRAVAEGIEDRADWDFVREAGCDLGQGHYVAKAMPAEMLIAWAEQWTTQR